MESYNITVRYIGLGAIGVAALALIVAALLRQPEPPLPPAVARGTAGQRDKVTRHPGLTLVREVAA